MRTSRVLDTNLSLISEALGWIRIKKRTYRFGTGVKTEAHFAISENTVSLMLSRGEVMMDMDMNVWMSPDEVMDEFRGMQVRFDELCNDCIFISKSMRCNVAAHRQERFGQSAFTTISGRKKNTIGRLKTFELVISDDSVRLDRQVWDAQTFVMMKLESISTMPAVISAIVNSAGDVDRFHSLFQWTEKDPEP